MSFQNVRHRVVSQNGTKSYNHSDCHEDPCCQKEKVGGNGSKIGYSSEHALHDHHGQPSLETSKETCCRSQRHRQRSFSGISLNSATRVLMMCIAMTCILLCFAELLLLSSSSSSSHTEITVNTKSRRLLSAPSRIYRRITEITTSTTTTSSSSNAGGKRRSIRARQPTVGASGKDTRPTLLSVVDTNSDEYMNALENDLYESLKGATFHDPVVSGSTPPAGTPLVTSFSDQDQAFFESSWERPHLSLDSTEIRTGQPLRLSWDSVVNSLGDSAVSDDDIILMFCGADQNATANTTTTVASTAESFQLLEAATIRQIRSTTAKNYGTRVEETSSYYNEWYIPSFPVIRHQVCLFHMYHTASAEEIRAANDQGDASTAEDQKYVLTAQSAPLYLQSLDTPTAIHMALTRYPTEMVINFVTGDSDGKPVVSYNMVNDSVILQAWGTWDTYTADDMCQAPASETEPGKFQSPGLLHTVVLTGLQPNTDYQYRVGLYKDQDDVTWSDVYSFTSALATGDPQPFAFLFYADQGCPAKGWGYGGQWTTALAAREIIDRRHNQNDGVFGVRAIHHIGDLSYAHGAAHIWDEWFAMIQPIATSVPLMVGIGNHEYDHTDGGQNGKDPSGVTTPHGFMPPWGNFDQDSGGECGVPAAKRFSMPTSTGSNGVFWYSYDMGSVHVVMISSEHDLGSDSPQHQWLYQDLASVDRSKTPWLIIESHRPLYESEISPRNRDVGIAMRYEIEDLLIEFNVDLFLSGHYHAYHRTCDGLYAKQCNVGGPMHITVGTAGGFLDDAELYWTRWAEKYIQQEYGYGRITVLNATTLHFEFVKADDPNDPSTGEVLDDVWITRYR